MNEDGTNNRSIWEGTGQANGALPSWSPNGKYIAFTKIITDTSNPQSPQQLYIQRANVDNESTVELTVTGNDQLPVWSPDGQYLYYTNVDYANSKANIFRVKADGSGSPENVGDPNRDALYFDISPDGSKLVYLAVDSSTMTYVLYQKNLNTNIISPFTTFPTGTIPLFPQWSPDGSKVAIYGFSETNGQTDSASFFVTDADGSNLQRVTPQNEIATLPTLSTHMWSPDSSKLLYVTIGNYDNNGYDNSYSNIHIVNVNTHQSTALTNQNMREYNFPNWAADGQKVAFSTDMKTAYSTAQNPNTNVSHHIFTMNTDGTNMTDMTPGFTGVAQYPVWETRLQPSSVTQNGVTTTTVAPGESFTEDNFTVPQNTVFVNNGRTGDITVQNGGSLKGSGQSGDVTVGDGGAIAPGNSPGCLSVQNLTLQQGSRYENEIAGTTACSGYDQVTVSGTVTLSDARLDATFTNGFPGQPGASYTIVKNDGSSPVSGTFEGLAEGAAFSVLGATFTITYQGGDGNDVVITQQSLPTQPVPGTPNTGFALLMARPLQILFASTLCAAVLFGLSRRYAAVD